MEDFVNEIPVPKGNPASKDRKRAALRKELHTQGKPADGQAEVYNEDTGRLEWSDLTGSGAPNTVDYLVGTANAILTNEIVVGTTPGGELGGTWPSPTVDATHSGSAHHAAESGESATHNHGNLYYTETETDGLFTTHEGAADPHTGYRLESADHTHQSTGLQAGQLDHGLALTGLADDDHPQYVKDGDAFDAGTANITTGGAFIADVDGAQGVPGAGWVIVGAAGDAGLYGLATVVALENTNGGFYFIASDGQYRFWDGVLLVQERAASEGTVSGWGQFWTKTGAPCRPMFTDDAGTDFDLLDPNPAFYTIDYVIDGGGAVITTGTKGDLEVAAGTIAEVRLLADQTGSIVIDIWNDTYANYPPTVADTITASAKPTISAGIKDEDTTLTGWTTTLADGDILRFNVDSVTDIERVTIVIKVQRS